MGFELSRIFRNETGQLGWRWVVGDGCDDRRHRAADVGDACGGTGLVDDVGSQQEELGDRHDGDDHEDDRDDDGGV